MSKNFNSISDFPKNNSSKIFEAEKALITPYYSLQSPKIIDFRTKKKKKTHNKKTNKKKKTTNKSNP